MKTIVHKANSRGYANYGWLDTHYSFSFANYYNPERIRFGALRVINDDSIDGGMGFDTHPHDNMEIVTIVLEGELRHSDSMGHTSVIKSGEVQVMSAGTGITHSEHNNLPYNVLRLFQIWVFPKVKNVNPRYDQKFFDSTLQQNRWQTVVSPNLPDTLRLNQDTWFSIAELDSNRHLTYSLNSKANGVYIMNIEGETEILGHHLSYRDAIGIWDTPSVEITSLKASKVLLIEVPLAF